jgi:hypothetical protein
MALFFADEGEGGGGKIKGRPGAAAEKTKEADILCSQIIRDRRGQVEPFGEVRIRFLFALVNIAFGPLFVKPDSTID